MAEYYHVVPEPGDYDPAQKALIASYLQANPLGQGVHYMNPSDVSSDPVPAPLPGQPQRASELLLVDVYFGDDSLHLVSGDRFRMVSWAGGGGSSASELAVAVSSLRRISTTALLRDPELEVGKREVDRWMGVAEVPAGRFSQTANALRKW